MVYKRSCIVCGDFDCKDIVLGIDLNEVKRLVDSWTLESNNTEIARLFRDMLDNGCRMEISRVKERIGDAHMADMTEDSNRNWNMVFQKDDDGYFYIRDEADEFGG